MSPLAGQYQDSVGRARSPSTVDQGVDGTEGSGCGIDGSSGLKVFHVDFKALDSRSWKFGLQRQGFAVRQDEVDVKHS